MTSFLRFSRGSSGRRAGNRRGSALILVLIFTTGIAALAMGAIYMSSTSAILTRVNDRDHELKYAAEAALAMGKSRLAMDAMALPDSGLDTLQSNASIRAADGTLVPWMRTNLYIGPTGSTTGQFGRFASVVADVSDPRGGRAVRRLELTQESFAKYAYWSNRETSGFGTIYFGSGDILYGPVWSNDVISINTTGASFRDEVGTARTISGQQYGTFAITPKINQPVIPLPSTAQLARLAGYAASGNLSFTAPNSLTETGVLMRLEFINLDMNADGDALDGPEGFVRVYTANAGQTAWLRGTLDRTAASLNYNCGDFHMVGGRAQFFPMAIHNTAWFLTLTGATSAHSTANVQTIMSSTNGSGLNARCYPGGDPHLVAIERNSAAFTNAQKQIGGEDSTFTAVGTRGRWTAWAGAAVGAITTARPLDGAYLNPLGREYNPNAKGVVYVNGTTAVSGVVRGRVTLYSNQYLVILDDLTYATDPAAPLRACRDILGMVAARDIVVADNTQLTPQNVASTGTVYRTTDETGDFRLHSVMMALSTSYRVQNYNTGPTTAQPCDATVWGRGCMRLAGGIIQESRGAVGTSGGTGFVKRYSYDRCAATNPPPYFPTTGRFVDNRYYEIDPRGFNPVAYYASLRPTP